MKTEIKAVADKFKELQDINKVAKALSIHISNAYRRLAQARALGLLDDKKPADASELTDNNPITSEDAVFYPADFIPKTDDPDILNYKPRPEYKIMVDALEHGENVMLIGEAGTGKTSGVKFYASQAKLPFLHISCDNLLEFGEVLGYQGLKNGNTHFTEGALIKLACENPAIVLFDEITMIDAGKNGRLNVFAENRKFFVKEANGGAGRYYTLHPKTKIVFAGNPPTALYVGAGKLNIALISRTRVIWTPTFTPAELKRIFNGEPRSDEVIKFYTEAKEAIETQKLRTTFSIRDVKKIFDALKRGYSIKDALTTSYLNAVKMTAGQEVYDSFLKLSLMIFKQADEKNKTPADPNAEADKGATK